MPVSGLVVSVNPGLDVEHVAEQLRAAGPFTVGTAIGGRLPVALEAEAEDAMRRWHEWAQRLPGVAKVDLAFVHGDRVENDNHAAC